MTRRFLQFASFALIGTVVVAAALAFAYGQLTVNNLTEMGAEQNSTLARSMSNASRTQIVQLLAQPSTLSRDEYRSRAQDSGLAVTLEDLSRDLSVYRVHLFNSDGIIVFSTDESRIGGVAKENLGVNTALTGETISDIVRRDSWNAFDKQVERLDLIQSYVPIRGSSGEIMGVFEVYSNVTPLLARISSSQWRVALGVTGTLGPFYLVLVWLYRRTDRNLQAEQALTRSYLEKIEATNATLEDRVAERTRELENARRFLQTGIDGVPDPTVVIAADYRITSLNKAARSLLGIDVSDGEAVYCYRALHGLSEPCHLEGHACTLDSGEPCTRIDRRARDNGEIQQLEIRTMPLRAPDGALTGALEVLHDLDSREQAAYSMRQAKERAEAASQIKSEFVATMSHEIRTPMNAVLGMTDLLRLTELTRKQRGYIEIIQSSGNMLLSLVDNILDFSRLGAGVLQLQSREFSVIELLERMVEITGYHACAKGLELVLDLNIDLGDRVRADENRLRQILINFVSNAIKFSDQGEVVVTADLEDRADDDARLQISVQDRGIGMTDEVQKQLFDPFAVVDEEAAGKQQGSGIGLAICKQLIERMGGEIGFDSTEGEGTRVWFSVPVERGESPEITEPLPALQGRRVLLVCQNPVVARAVCAYAASWGLNCEISTSAADALARLQLESTSETPFELAVIDNATIGVSGLGLAHRIRWTDGVTRLPVALLTPISQPLEPGEISSIGRILCVNKPVLPSELELVLFRLLDPSYQTEREDEADVAVTEHGGELHILIAEDNLVNRRVLLGMLNSLGYSADCVEDGPAVLTTLEKQDYDVVLMDCQMPGMDGERVTEHIRGDPDRFPNQPVVVAITADASLEHRSACLAAGMDDFIAKPLRLAKLTDGLERWRGIAAARVRLDETIIVKSDMSVDQVAREQLRDRGAGQAPTFLNDYIDLFLVDTHSRLGALEAAFGDADLEVIKRESHALKGACLEFGVVRMGRYCDELRACADRGRLDEVAPLLGSLRREFDRIRPVLEAEKAGQATGL